MGGGTFSRRSRLLEGACFPLAFLNKPTHFQGDEVGLHVLVKCIAQTSMHSSVSLIIPKGGGWDPDFPLFSMQGNFWILGGFKEVILPFGGAP